MKGGTQLYDIIVLVGVIVLIFVVFYWAVTYGAQLVSDMLYSAPSTVQDSLASFIGAGCIGGGNMTVELAVTPTPLTAVLGAKTINVLPPEDAYRGGRTIERGGYVKFGPPSPIAYVRCAGTNVATGNVTMNPAENKAFVVNKTDGKITLGVE
ncbi:MAG: hypothetical protein QXU82_01430 [Candidatus Aenigmatarchaeota archaeon]